MPGALEGIRVIDLTQMLAGPFSAMNLADHGADVIKVEPPKGEDLRRVPPLIAGESGAFMLWNRNKRGITLDLKKAEDKALLLELLEETDVLMESFRPGVMARLGLDWDSLKTRFPRLIMASISGYGQTGPLASRGGFDVMAQGMSGLMAINGPREGPPHRLPIPICDLTAGLYLTVGILSAVQARHRTGMGQYVETSLLEAAAAIQVYEAVHYFSTGNSPQRMGNAHRGIAPYQVFPTMDGYVTIGAGQQHFYEAFCKLANMPELVSDPRFLTIPDRVAHNDVLIELLSQATRQHSTDWWIEQLEALAIPCGPVYNHEQLFTHPQMLHRRMVEIVQHPKAGALQTLGIPLKLSGTPGSVRSAAPLLGEHSAAICSALSERPQRNHNLFAALRAAFPQDMNATAVEVADGVGAGGLYSWLDLERGSAMMANLLASLNLPVGARVAVQLDKSVESLMLYLAVLRAGYVYLPLNNAYQAAEVEYFLGNAEPSVVVCTGRALGWMQPLAMRLGVLQVFTLEDNRSGTLLQQAAQHSDVHTMAVRGRDDLAAILYTSGTTGRSKGAMLSHGNLLSNAQVLKDYWDWRVGDVLIHALPIFHAHGLFVASHGALLNGSRMLWFQKFDAKAVIARLPEATVFMGVPTLYVRMLEEAALTQEACHSMRLFISGSAPMLQETFQLWQQRTGHTILERYGMSETVMLTSNPCKPQDGERVGATVGFPLPGVQLRIQDETGRSVATGEIGGIQVKGPNVFGGYWRMPEKTAEEFTADGWFKTGDVGKSDAQGRVTIVGRSKDLIISGGYNVYPAEIESWLNDMPVVQESAVIGVPHPDFGEAVVAVLVLRSGMAAQPEEIVTELKGRIAGFKVPKAVYVETELPRNTMGKVLKNVLRTKHQALFAPGA